MGIAETILKGIERLVLPELREIKNEQKAQRELMEEKFKSMRELMDEKFRAVEWRFDDLKLKLQLDQRLTVLEDRAAKLGEQEPKN